MGLKKWNNPSTNTYYSPLYHSWNDMINRAGNKNGNNPSYIDTTVCERWLSYDNFFDDMASTWKPGMCLDKDIVKPGNHVYCKEYCKWVSRSENTKDMHHRNPNLGSKITGKNNPMKKLENRKKFTGKNSAVARKVKCIETGKIYDCCRDAERELFLKSSTVSNAANPNNSRKLAGGYHWEYL